MTRLPSRLIVDLLLRSASVAGGFAAVIAHGDDHSGSLLIQCRERDVLGLLLERQFDGSWQPIGPATAATDTERNDYTARRRRADPDLWLIQLDIPEAPQFVAALTEGA